VLLEASGFFGFGTLFAIPAFAGAKYGKIQKNRTLDVGTFLACAPNIIVNLIAGSAFGSFLMAKGLPDSAFDWRALPSTSTLMKEAAVWVAANEVIFFYTHRWMHINKYLYAKIHKIHHTWTSPISFTAAYSHPLEVLLGNVVPLAAGPLLCGSHIMGACIWFFFYQVHTTCTHSGYWICDDHGLHDVHHAKFNYNYGVHGIMDHIYGTHLLPEEDKKQTQ